MPNLPVPEGPRAPVSIPWLFTHAPYAAVVGAYRLIPDSLRRNWNRHGGYASTSHQALADILRPVSEGGGRRAFVRYTTPRFHGRKQPRGYATAWALLLLALALPFLGIEKTYSWAN